MKRITDFAIALLLLTLSASAQVSSGGGAGGGVPGLVVTVAPGASLKGALERVADNATVQLGSGTYTVTPSILNSNLTSGNTFTGITLANKTNVTIQGVIGRTIIDGSSGLGEAMWISNCSSVRIIGVTFKGMTNHNINALPTYGAAVGGLWALVNFYQCERLEFLNCSFIGSADHGLQDKGAENSGFVASSSISTNGILVDTCYFSDIGGWRTNSGGGGSIAKDGTAIVCTGMTVRNCTFENCLRGVEPYNENDAAGVVFKNCSIQRNNFLNMIDQGVCTVGSTNGHEIVISDNFFDETAVLSYHGTNVLTTGSASTPGYAISITGGRGHNINNNIINRSRYLGILVGGAVMDDCTVDGNKVFNVGNGVTGFGYIMGYEDSTVRPVTRLNFFNNTARSCTKRGLYVLGVRDGYFRNCTIENPTLYGEVGNVIHASGNNRNTNLFFSNCAFTDRTGFQTYAMSVTAGNVNVNFDGCVLTGGSAGKYDNNVGDELSIFGPAKTFSLTTDFPSLAAGGSFRMNWPATGTRTNDLVELMVPNQFYGLSTNVIPVAWASNDAVWLYVHNAGPAAVDPANTRFRATVRQVEAY